MLGVKQRSTEHTEKNEMIKDILLNNVVEGLIVASVRTDRYRFS